MLKRSSPPVARSPKMDDFKQINDQLAAFPEQIYKATKRAEDLRESSLLEEARKDYEFAKAFLTAKVTNITEGQAKAKAVEAVYETTQAVIIAESSYRRALADQIRLENEFTSIRKRANLFEATMQRIGAAA